MSDQILNIPVSQFVTEDYRTASVFKQYGLDFCCGGKEPLGEACEKNNVDKAEIVSELQRIVAQPAAGMPRFREWSTDLLIEYIKQNHHSYVRDAIPRISPFINKIAHRHGDSLPHNVDIARLFNQLSEEMLDHLKKEEKEQFPLVLSVIEKQNRGETPNEGEQNKLRQLQEELEEEHEYAANLVSEIARLSSNYTPHEGACPTYQATYKELEAFEKDLHHHVHLENNVLFPRALSLITN